MAKEELKATVTQRESLESKDIKSLREMALKYDDLIPTTYSKKILINYILTQQAK